MICKKCGREYEDDMPKCLWCDAPKDCEPTPTELYCDSYKDSPEKLVDPKLEKSLLDNLYRGKSVISWTKFTIVLNILLLLVEIKTFEPINAGIEGPKVNIPLSNEFFLAGFILIGFLLFIAIPTCVYTWKNWVWIYHAQKTQGSFTETFFAPWGAVLCYFIPVVNYFIFKDLLKSQNKTLTILSGNAKPIPSKMLNGYLAINIIMPICNFVSFYNNNEVTYLLLGDISWVIFIICNLKLIRAAMNNERELHTLLYNNEVNHKAEELIAQRDVENQNADLA